MLCRGKTMNERFKVDLRIRLEFEGICYDLSSIAFKKDGDSTQSMLEDEGKVLVEGKTILNSITKLNNCKFEEAKLKVIVGQFCGKSTNKINTIKVFIIKVVLCTRVKRLVPWCRNDRPGSLSRKYLGENLAISYQRKDDQYLRKWYNASLVRVQGTYISFH